MPEYKNKSGIMVPPEYAEGTIPRRDFLKSALETAVAAYLGKKLLGSSSAYAQQPISAPTAQLRYDPGDISILSTPIGRQALEIAVTGGLRARRETNPFTTILADGIYDRLLFAPTPTGAQWIARNGLSFEGDYIPSIIGITDTIANNTNRRIRFNDLIVDEHPLTSAAQQNRNALNIAIYGIGEEPFTGDHAGDGGQSITFTNRSDRNTITGARISLNASNITIRNSLRAITAQEVIEGFFLSSEDLNLRSPVPNPGTLLVYDPIPKETLEQFTSDQTLLAIDEALLKAIYALGAGVSLEEAPQRLRLSLQ